MSLRTSFPVLVAGLIVAAGLCGANASAAIVADFQDDFTGPTNGHADTEGTGSWNYYRSNTADPSDAGANLAAYTWYGTGNYFKDPSAGHGQVQSTNLHPGDGNYVVARWETGTTSTFNVDGLFQRQVTNGDGVDVYVYSNGVELVNAVVPPTAGQSAAFNFNTNLGTGQYVDFVVGPRTSLSYDRTTFDVSIADATMPTVANWSFEEPVYVPGGTEGGTTVPGWGKENAAYSSPGIQIDGKGGSPPAADGNQWCFFNLVDNQSGTGGNTGSIWQDVGIALDDYFYTVGFTLGNRSANDADDFDVSLWAGGTGPSLAEGATLIGLHTVTPPAVSSTTTQTYSEIFATGTGLGLDTLWVRFDAYIPAGTSGALDQLLIDAVSIGAMPVPEPATLVLFTLGGLAILLTQRRRRR